MSRVNASVHLVLLVILVSLAACGSKPQATAPEPALQDAAGTAVQAYAESAGTPFRNVKYSTPENDGAFATVLVEAEFRGSAQEAWHAEQLTVPCKKIGKVWQCESAKRVAKNEVAPATAVATVAPSQQPTMIVTAMPRATNTPVPIATVIGAATQPAADGSSKGDGVLASIESLRYLRMSGSDERREADGQAKPACTVTAEYGFTSLGVPISHWTTSCPGADVWAHESYDSAFSTCSRYNNEATASCFGTGRPFVSSISQLLGAIVRGEPRSKDMSVTDKGSGSSSFNGKPCVSYFRQEQWTADNWVSVYRDEVCFDPSTNLPVRWSQSNESKRDGQIQSTTTQDFVVEDTDGSKTIEVPPASRAALVEVATEKTDAGDGWANFSAQLATINADTEWHAVSWKGNFLVRTGEGYDYRGKAAGVGDSSLYLPPGFAARGYSGCSSGVWLYAVTTKVADASANFRVAVDTPRLSQFGRGADPYGPDVMMEVTYTPADELFPIAIPMPGFRAIGAREAGNLAGIAEVSIGDVKSDGDRTVVKLDVKNLQGGYQFSEWVSSYIIGDGGLIYRNCNSSSGRLEAGPSQTVSLEQSFGVPPDVKDRYLVVTAGLDPAIGGVVFKLD